MRGTWFALALACPAATLAAPSCPQFEGSFTVSGPRPAVDGALLALGASRNPDAVGGQISVSAWSGQPLRLSFRPAQADPRRPPMDWVLNSPADFRCENGWLVMRRRATDSRDGFDGQATVRIAPARNGDGLQLEVYTTRRESARLFSYDSAKVDVPLPWSSKSAERLFWPGGDIVVWQGKPPPGYPPAPSPAVTPPPPPPPAPRSADPAAVTQARQLLTRTGLRLGDIKAEETTVRAQVLATPDELARLEDALRAAGVAYAIPASPVQTASAYFVDVLLPQDPSAASRPSRLWVEREVTRFLPSGASVNKSEWQDGAWNAQLGLLNGQSAEDALRRLRSGSQAFSDVRVLPGTERALSGSMRVVDVRLSPR